LPHHLIYNPSLSPPPPPDCKNKNLFTFVFFVADAVPTVGPAGYINYTGNTHLPVMNQASTSNIGAGNENLLKLQVPLSDYHQQSAGRLARVGNPGAVSTGLRLSYEDDERNSSITSGSGSMASLPATMSCVDGFMAELDKESKEINFYLRLQVNIQCSSVL
jgi:E3 ubiquitin-protein ligase BOI and related proteins